MVLVRDETGKIHNVDDYDYFDVVGSFPPDTKQIVEVEE